MADTAKRPRFFTRPPPMMPRGPPPQARKSARSRKNGQSSDFFEGVLDALRRTSSQPDVLCLLALALLVAYDITHIDRLAAFFSARTSTTQLGSWISANSQVIAGLVILLPGLYKFPVKSRFIAGIVTFVTVLALPSQSSYVYFAVSLGMTVFWQVRQPGIRLVLFSALLLYLYVFNGAALGISPTTSATPPPVTTTTASTTTRPPAGR
ncbi:hypothetical protein [Sanxia atyid shrimp virus 1]|uniref:hypothetical protein n=1 Tax=Sanxia atyid shrimp virus 1 TaxID=1923355 RepID=UPI000909A7CB|nr:hypothetical protein [Sanxia atyid shrimp virus 1]APG77739.1 hypothetical protein [Sanxia atyid shrimp virus 1]